MRFATYSEARDFAASQVRRLRMAHGIERAKTYTHEGEWHVMMLPRPENRSGWELRVEAIEVRDER
jgi:hypothetical protein